MSRKLTDKEVAERNEKRKKMVCALLGAVIDSKGKARAFGHYTVKLVFENGWYKSTVIKDRVVEKDSDEVKENGG